VTLAVGKTGKVIFAVGKTGNVTFAVGTTGIRVVMLGIDVMSGGWPPPKSQG
jgi:hypothetical protein